MSGIKEPCDFPLFISLRGKRVQIYGAGTIALRRVKTLVSFGAEISVAAPEGEEELLSMSRAGTIHYENTLVRDADGNPIKETVPLFDKDFGDELYDSAGVPSGKTSIGKRIRLWYDPRKLLFNPGNDVQGEIKGREFFDQLPFSTLADVINNDWWMPSYEVQRPAGVYVVDSAPANTMVCQHC